MSTSHFQAYLGDGLYVEYDGFQVRLFTSNGIAVTNEVYLEPRVLSEFLGWVAQLQEALRQAAKEKLPPEDKS